MQTNSNHGNNKELMIHFVETIIFLQSGFKPHFILFKLHPYKMKKLFKLIPNCLKVFSKTFRPNWYKCQNQTLFYDKVQICPVSLTSLKLTKLSGIVRDTAWHSSLTTLTKNKFVSQIVLMSICSPPRLSFTIRQCNKK